MNSPRVHTLSLLSFLAAGVAAAQSPPTHTWIFFRDRGHVSIDLSAPTAAKELGISPRALSRRSKVLPPGRLLDERDLPVAEEYVAQLVRAGVSVRSTSRWLNAASALISAEQRMALAQFSFIAGSSPVARLRRPPVSISPTSPGGPLQKTASLLLNYGPSFTQLNNIKVVDVHNLGINGTGVIIGMIDDGFNNHTVHNALKNIRILDEFDFIHRIPSTMRQQWENASQGDHGAATLSALAGFAEGTLIGAAYGASIILAKTEMDSTEVPAEEDLYVEALEWMEQLGADVVSTSLGYIDWYTYDSLDGRTAITSKAARIAASKGVLLVTAMGNEGHFRGPGLTGTLIAPADADSIVAVGATFSDYEIASFSSTGPTVDGRVKPEVMAQGVGVVSANGQSTSSYIFASGTSLSTPLAAGVAALVLSAQPELTPMQVRSAMIQTAFRFSDPFVPSRTTSYPNSYYGFGILNAFEAILTNGPVFSNQPTVTTLDSSLLVTTSIASKLPLLPDSIVIYYRYGSGGPFQSARLNPRQSPYQYEAILSRQTGPGPLVGYFSAQDNSGIKKTSPYNAPDSLFALEPIAPEKFLLYSNFPNPFNERTNIRFDIPSSGHIELFVFDLLGRRVKTIFNGFIQAGTFTKSWDGTGEFGKGVSTGVYFFQLRTSKSVLTGKMLYLK